MDHHLTIKCRSCDLLMEYSELDQYIIAVRLPYCCDAVEHVITVSPTTEYNWDTTPGRGVRFVIGKDRWNRGTDVECDNASRYTREYYPAPPKNKEEEVYFISELRTHGAWPPQFRKYRKYKMALIVETLNNWKAVSPEFQSVPLSPQVVLLDAQARELPLHVCIIRPEEEWCVRHPHSDNFC